MRPQLDELARIAGLSKYHFVRCFRRTLGMPPHQYQLVRRIAEVRRMLTRSAQSVGSIAVSLGYSNQSHFTAAFRASSGMSPAAYRAAYFDRCATRVCEPQRARLNARYELIGQALSLRTRLAA